jgi:hypothetical protein
VKGSHRFKIDGLYKHANSDQHRSAQELASQLTKMKKTIDHMWMNQHQDLSKLLGAAKFCVGCNLSIRSYPKVCQLLRNSGVRFKTELYHTEYGFLELLNSASYVLKRKLEDKVKSSSFYSIIIDESTDISSTQELALIIRYFDKTSVAPRTEIMALIKMTNGDASYIKSCILMLLKSWGLSLPHLVGIATDGAAVMVGEENGVAAKLTEYCPFLVANHCIAHRLNLAYKSTENIMIREFEQVDDLVHGVYKYFKNSSKKLMDLERFAKLRKRKIYKILKIYDIRWLSKYNAFDNILKDYDSLLDLLQSHLKDKQRSDKERKVAANLHKSLSNPSLIFC